MKRFLSIGCIWLLFFEPSYGQKTNSPLLEQVKGFFSGAEGGKSTNRWPVYRLNADTIWQLETPKRSRFDASALLLTKNGLLTINDKNPVLFQVLLPQSGTAGKLIPWKGSFHRNNLRAWTTNRFKQFDFEGLAQDEAGRIYLCEEQRRAVFRFDPKSRSIRQLNIDWSPVAKFFADTEKNASFEGIAVGGGKLFLANERSEPRVIVVDLSSLKGVDHFLVKSAKFSFIEPHYSDLCWFEGHLYVLLRHQQTVLQVNPANHEVVAEYDFGSIESKPEIEYLNEYPTGTMEGLAVNSDYFYLITDNNGKGRKKFTNDTRPTLIRCKRPEQNIKPGKTR